MSIICVYSSYVNLLKQDTLQRNRTFTNYRAISLTKGFAVCILNLAEAVRFELTDNCSSAVFKTAGLNHSPKPPEAAYSTHGLRVLERVAIHVGAATAALNDACWASLQTPPSGLKAGRDAARSLVCGSARGFHGLAPFLEVGVNQAGEFGGAQAVGFSTQIRNLLLHVVLRQDVLHVLVHALSQFLG